MNTTLERKRFQTPPCLGLYGVDANDIDFDPLPEVSAQRLAPGAELGIEQTTRRARPTRKRIPYRRPVYNNYAEVQSLSHD